MCFIKHDRPVIPPSHEPIITQPEAFDIDQIPMLRMSQRWNPEAVREPDLKPQCASVDSKKTPLQPLMSETKGWELWEQPGTHGEKKFWRATEVGSIITFEVDLQVGYM